MCDIKTEQPTKMIIKRKKKLVVKKTDDDLKKQLREKDEEIEKLKNEIEELKKMKTPKKREYKYVEERCCCGAKYNKTTRARHMKTKKHQDWVKANGGTDIIEGFKSKLHIKELPREEEGEEGVEG